MMRRRSLIALFSALGALACALVTGAGPAAADNPYHTVWKITGTSGYSTVTGSWHVCVYFSAESTAHTVTCSLSTSTTTTVSGTLNVSADDASASVGFSVSKTYGVTGGESYTATKSRSGHVDWAPVYQQKSIYQAEYSCPRVGNGCIEDSGRATAYAKKYSAPTFRITYT